MNNDGFYKVSPKDYKLFQAAVMSVRSDVEREIGQRLSYKIGLKILFRQERAKENLFSASFDENIPLNLCNWHGQVEPLN